MSTTLKTPNDQRAPRSADSDAGELMNDNDGVRLISVVIPCYQEESFITSCLASVRAFILPVGWDLEALVVDGGSSDATRQLVTDFAAHDRRFRLLDNPRRTQSSGLNIGIQASRGEYILRLDAHSTYPTDYLAHCLQTSLRTDCDNVGGIALTQTGGSGYQASLTQALTSHRFGVGSSFRTGAKEGRADTVPYGFFRRDTFERFGLFDERLARAQDYEFNRRIVARGGQIWLDPQIIVRYSQQPTLKSFLRKQFFLDAPYNAYMWYLAPYTFTPRHAITALFVVGLMIGLLLVPASPAIAGVAALVLGAYALLALGASVQQAIRYRQLRHVFVLPFCFLAYHVTHGLGVLTGIVRLALRVAPTRREDAAWTPGTVPVSRRPLEPVLVSVVVPCYQEVGFINACLESVRNFVLPPQVSIEVLVVDGGSTDGTRAAVQDVIMRDARFRLMDNPRRTQAVGLNIGIGQAMGDYIMRLDAHSTYPTDYLEQCLRTARRTRCENVGGIFDTRARGPAYHASLVQALTTHWFGVGRSFRTTAEEGPADTVAYGFFRSETFEKFGLIDERLVRAEDYEYNRRITANGGRVWLNPDIVVEYSQQATLQDFLHKQFFVDAPYNAYMWYLAPYTFAARHAASAFFALGMILGLPLALLFPSVADLLLFVVAVYGGLALIASMQQALRYRRWRHALFLPFSFLAYHVTHGLGVLAGIGRIVLGKQPTKKSDPPWRDSPTVHAVATQ
jgi:glycosyltransferase involved in cell wall biosynthesis